MIVLFSPSKGFFVGCEPAGFGGVEGPAQFSKRVSKALDLQRDWESFESTAKHHLGYVRSDAPDAIALQGPDREDLKKQALVHAVHDM